MEQQPNSGPKVSFIGLRDLRVEERDIVTSIASKHLEKIERLLPVITEVQVHIKVPQRSSDPKDKRHRFSANVRVISPSHTFETTEQDDFELPLVIHRVFERMVNEIEHKIQKKKG